MIQHEKYQGYIWFGLASAASNAEAGICLYTTRAELLRIIRSC